MSQNVEMTEIFNKASKSIADAFNDGGEVLAGRVGAACASCWGDGSDEYFKKKLVYETEKFLFDKVEKIIGLSNEYTTSTQNFYNNGMKA